MSIIVLAGDQSESSLYCPIFSGTLFAVGEVNLNNCIVHHSLLLLGKV